MHDKVDTFTRTTLVANERIVMDINIGRHYNTNALPHPILCRGISLAITPYVERDMPIQDYYHPYTLDRILATDSIIVYVAMYIATY